MPKSTRSALAIVAGLLGVCLMQPNANAIDPSSAACKQELNITQRKMDDVLALTTLVQNAPALEKCKAYSKALDLTGEIRESFARCEEPKARDSAVRDADEVFDATQVAFEKWCPARPGMVRIRMVNVEHKTREQLPKPLADVHRCGGDAPMYFINERFDLGRIVEIGCPGAPNPSAADVKARNARIELLQKEQVAVYHTRDRDGDDPRRLTFPILAADGSEAMTDLLFAGRVSIGAKLDIISAFWEPSKEGVCRVHAVWRVADGKPNPVPKLVLWRELSDCDSGSANYKIVLDRR